MTTTALPRVSPAAVHARVRTWLGGDRTAEAIALRGAPAWDGEPTLTVTDGTETVEADVRCAATVLGVLDALTTRTGEGPLVIITPLSETDLGPTVLSRLHRNEIRLVDHWDTVTTLAGVGEVEPLLRQSSYAWLAEAAAGIGTSLWTDWTRPAVLRRDTLLSRVAAHRIGRDPRDGIDIAALLEWADRGRWDATWGRLPEAEIRGLRGYLSEPGVAGPVAAVALDLAERGHRVIPLGLACRELYADTETGDPVVREARIRFEGRYLDPADTPDETTLKVFGEQSYAVLSRWHASGAGAVADTAEHAAAELLESLRADRLAARSAWMETGFHARAGEFAAAVAAFLKRLDRDRLDQTALTAAETAFDELAAHQRADETRLAAHRAAIRLLRWLTLTEPAPRDLASWLEWHTAQGGWVDRACAVLYGSDTPYAAALFNAVRRRRRALDRAYATELAKWTGERAEHSRLLRIEDVLAEIAEPVAKAALPPLILVLDGMSAADAPRIAEDLAALREWTEIVPADTERRRAALAALPSETVHSRTSLLTGHFASGGQDAEDRGFRAFWNRRNRHGSQVFHKDDLRRPGGGGLPDPVRAALADTGRAVAAVLNRIDDALDADERRATPEWELRELDHAADLLAEAGRAGRPVIVCSDHGHIRDWGTERPERADHARWLPGDAATDGEIVLDGGRLAVPGPVRLAWDETRRYTSRRAGYHGGAGLAETTVPILVFLPTGHHAPKGWTALGRSAAIQPEWWRGRLIAASPEPPAPPETDTLLAASSFRLGAQVTASPRYGAKARALQRNKPDEATVAAVLDLLDHVGGKAPIEAVAERLGRPPGSAARWVKQTGRLLNEPGAETLALTDGGTYVTLNAELLRTQFLGGR